MSAKRRERFRYGQSRDIEASQETELAPPVVGAIRDDLGID